MIHYSFLGFNNYKIAVKDFEINKSIQLKEIIYELEEIKVKSGILQKIGIIDEKQTRSSADMPLRLHIYSVGENGLPDKELLKQQIVISENEHKDGVISINVKNQNIFIEKASFFIGLQFIRVGNIDIPKGRKNDIGIGETSRIAKRLSFHRGRVFNYQWYSYNETGVLIPSNIVGGKATIPIPLKGNPCNLLASAEIEVY